MAYSARPPLSSWPSHVFSCLLNSPCWKCHGYLRFITARAPQSSVLTCSSPGFPVSEENTPVFTSTTLARSLGLPQSPHPIWFQVPSVLPPKELRNQPLPSHLLTLPRISSPSGARSGAISPQGSRCDVLPKTHISSSLSSADRLLMFPLLTG